MTTIYTLGYTGWTLDAVAAKVEQLDAVLVDVRMVPRSRIPAWNSGVLARRFNGPDGKLQPPRYVWLKEFGNRNYKGTADQIEIADFPAGEQRLRQLLGAGAGPVPTACRPIILLCGCADVNTCHRKLLADWLGQTWCVAQVQHLAPSGARGSIRLDNRGSRGQPTLF